LEQEALAKADSQIDSQALRDPDLAKVVTAWQTLAPALKAAILAITDSSNQIDSQINEARIYVNPNPA
jgi:ABC-type transporter Mla subunit MlaD